MRTGLLFRSKRTAGWPFWLLLAAWFCTNAPHEFTFELIVWAKGARHFSHADRLEREVALLLSGKSESRSPRVSNSIPSNPGTPIIPEESVVKRFEFCVPQKVESFAVAETEEWPIERFMRFAGLIRLEPPVPPPRFGAVA
jgi:hypothetical protein